jgi:hypothetical protein
MASSHLNPLVSIEDRKLTPQQERKLTLEMYWGFLLPNTEMPTANITASWLTFYSLDEIMAGIESAADYTKRKAINNEVSVGKIVSSTIRRLAAVKRERKRNSVPVF